MHKGRFYRRIVPYTASRNWGGDSFAPYRVGVNSIEFRYDGLILTVPSLITGPQIRDLRTLEFEWRFEAEVAGHTFRFAIGIQTNSSAPTNFFSMLIVDDLASSLLARWEFSVGQANWTSHVDTPGGPIALAVNGLFEPVGPTFSLRSATYSEEPP